MAVRVRSLDSLVCPFLCLRCTDTSNTQVCCLCAAYCRVCCMRGMERTCADIANERCAGCLLAVVAEHMHSHAPCGQQCDMGVGFHRRVFLCFLPGIGRSRPQYCAMFLAAHLASAILFTR